jgi:hypothetical protein
LLRNSELEIRSEIIAELVFCKQVLTPDVLTRATIGKYAAGFVSNNNCTNFAQKLLNRLTCSAVSIILYKSPQSFVDYILYDCGNKTINEIKKKKSGGVFVNTHPVYLYWCCDFDANQSKQPK